MSVDGFCALVPHAVKAWVRYLDASGVERSFEAGGWHARIVQHELDHLQETLYLDRMLSRTATTVENVTKHWKDVAAREVLRRLR